MKRIAIIFWMLYMLFFAIPFPMILYYTINSEYDITDLKDKNPWLVLSVLAISVLFWTILLAGFFQKWVLSVFVKKHRLEKLLVNGIRRGAKILSVSKVSKTGDKYDAYELDLSVNNLADTEIVLRKARVTDSRPYERRFEAGKKVDLLIDQELKHVPCFIFASTKVAINTKAILLGVLGWLTMLALIIGYYIYAYQSESFGMGWRFMSFAHPLIVCSTVLLLYHILGKIVFRITEKKPDKLNQIRFKGKRAAAKIVSARQTGRLMNAQPVIHFELEYTDDHQHKYHKGLEKVVNLLDLNSTQQERIDIFYLREDPESIAFASDINEKS